MTLSNNTLETTYQIPAAMRMWEWIDNRLAEARGEGEDGDPLPPLEGDLPHNTDHHVRVVANLKKEHSPESVKASLNHLIRHKELGHNVIGVLGSTQHGDSYLGSHRGLPYGKNNKATKIYGDIASNPKDVVRVAREAAAKTRGKEISPGQFRSWLYKRLHAKHVGGMRRTLVKRDAVEREDVPIAGGEEEGGEGVSQLHHGKGLSGGAAGAVAKRDLPDPWAKGLNDDELKSLGLRGKSDGGDDHNLPLQKLVKKSRRALRQRHKDDSEKAAGIHGHIAKTLDMSPDQLTRVFTHGSPQRSMRGAKPGKGVMKSDKFLAKAERASQKKKIHKLFGKPEDTGETGDITTRTTLRGKPAHLSGPPVRTAGEEAESYSRRLAKWEKKSKAKDPRAAGTEPFGVKVPGYEPTYAGKKLKGGKKVGEITPSAKERAEKLPTGGPSYVRLGGQWVSLKPGESLEKERETARGVIKAKKRAVFKGLVHKKWPDAPARKPKLRGKPKKDEGEEDWRFQDRLERWNKDKKGHDKEMSAWKEDKAKAEAKPLGGKSIAKELGFPEGKAGEQAVSRAEKSIRRRARLELGGRGITSPLPTEEEGEKGKGKAAKRGARTEVGKTKAAKAGRGVHPDWQKIPVPEMKPSKYRRERTVPPEAVKAMRIKRVGPAAKTFAARVTGAAKAGAAGIPEKKKAGPLTRAQLSGIKALQTDAEKQAAREAAGKIERGGARSAAAEKRSAAREVFKKKTGVAYPGATKSQEDPIWKGPIIDPSAKPGITLVPHAPKKEWGEKPEAFKARIAHWKSIRGTRPVGSTIEPSETKAPKHDPESKAMKEFERIRKDPAARAKYWKKMSKREKTVTQAGKERQAELERGTRKVLKLGSKPHQYQDPAELAKAKGKADIRRAQAHFAKAKAKHAMSKALAPARAAEKSMADEVDRRRKDDEILAAGRSKTESLFDKLFSNGLVETSSLFSKVFA